MMKVRLWLACLHLILLASSTTLLAQSNQVIAGEMLRWHTVTITFDGPATDESADPNPFLDYRLNVSFTNGDKTYLVPGYYAADGNAAETSASSGNKWRVHFTPDELGIWTYIASFRSGPAVAVSLNADESRGQNLQAEYQP
jgi:hypothetical protein